MEDALVVLVSIINSMKLAILTDPAIVLQIVSAMAPENVDQTEFVKNVAIWLPISQIFSILMTVLLVMVHV
jgi:hypothetical protein